MLTCIKLLTLFSLALSIWTHRRDAPAAAQGQGQGERRIREGQGGSQEPGVSCCCPTEAPAVCVTECEVAYR